MRRKDKEVKEIEEMLQIIKQCKICRLALCENNQPYIVPLNFGYQYKNEELTLYFHGTHAGKKMDILQVNPQVCFEMDLDYGLIEAPEPCAHGYAFESIVGFGRIDFMEDTKEKSNALNLLMKHQTGKFVEYSYSKQIDAITVYKLKVSSFTGKRKVKG